MRRPPADERRQAFVEAAVQVIASHGVKGATTRRIAEQAGAPLASLHYYFGSKEDLFFAVLQHVAVDSASLRVSPGGAIGLQRAAISWVEQAVAWNVESADDGRAAFELYFWALGQRADRPELASSVYELFIERTIASLRQNLLPGDDDQLVEPLARVLVAIADGIVLQWYGHGDVKRRTLDIETFNGLLDAFFERP